MNCAKGFHFAVEGWDLSVKGSWFHVVGLGFKES